MLAALPYNLRRARFSLTEISGAFGDLGTFLPLLVGMVGVNGLPFVSSLFFAGLFNFVTGLLYPIPMAVQPMKAIAAIALTEHLSPDEIVAAGLLTSLVVLVLGLTGGIHVVHRIVPKAVVRGLQLGIGLALAQQGLEWAFDGPIATSTGIIVLTSLALVLVNMRYAFPAALVIFAVGLVWEIASQPTVLAGVGGGLSLPQLAFPAWSVFPAAAGIALAQVPLTTLNSVISVVVLSQDLFPGYFAAATTDQPPVAPGKAYQPPVMTGDIHQPSLALGEARQPSLKLDEAHQPPVTLGKVSVTVGVMNIVGSLFGAMPMCHGAGGLAGQYRFGARTNGSILFLGGTKMLAAILFGLPLFALIQGYPQAILGVLLLAAGLELALASRRVAADRDFHLALLTAVTILVKGTLYGVLLGTAAYWFLTAFGRLRGERLDLGG